MSFVLGRVVRMLLVVGFVAAVFAAESSDPAAHAGVIVNPDPFASQYVVSGAVLLDHSFTGGSDRRVWATTCSACEWVLTDPCLVNGPNGRPLICGITNNPCPQGSLYQRVWFRDGPTMAWDPIGLICTRTTTLTRVRDVQSLISMRNVPVPPLRPTAQPAGRVFAGLPVWFATHQPRVMKATVNVLGWDVTVQAAPTWFWRFGDGATLSTLDPGARYPAGSVHHVYRTQGRVRPSVVSLWGAEWNVQDLPARPVDGSVTQIADIVLNVRPTRPILVPTVP